MLLHELKHAVEYWKTDGPIWVSRVAATKLVNLLYPVLPAVTYKSLHMLLRLGYWPNIRNPRSFNEKIVHRQLFAPHPLAPLVADKWRVREYIAKQGLAHILNEVYFVTDDPVKIPFDKLPDQFVIKVNHGSGWNIFVDDKRMLDRQEVVRKCQRWLSLRYGVWSRNYETHYDRIPPLVLVERFLHDGRFELPLDYKFLCFHGVVRYIYVVDRTARVPKLTFYDTDWRKLSINYVYPIGEAVPRPAELVRMLDIAACLSKGFDFVRIDLYAPGNGSIIAGEITLSPTGGLGVFRPRHWDFQLGDLW